ncbi:MAG: c-type cytochrome [Gammaproteobacteria bacterium]|nr:c-type cytochrome [Gammaproteobacteria bacterium]
MRPSRKQNHYAFAILISLFFSLTASAAWTPPDKEHKRINVIEVDVENGEEVYGELCAGCHSLEAWGSEDGEYPQIAGQHKSVLLKQVLDIRHKRRLNPPMDLIVAKNNLPDQDLADVVTYISLLPLSTDGGKGNGHLVKRGKRIFQQNCAVCHGPAGQGNDDFAYPKLQSQQYAYLLRQLKNVQVGKRQVPVAMSVIVKKLKEKDLYAITDYLSRIEPPKQKNASLAHMADIMAQFSDAAAEEKKVIEWTPLGEEGNKILALKADIKAGETLYKNVCAACHGAQGWGVTNGQYPQLAGQHKQVIVKQILDMRHRFRINPFMDEIVKPKTLGGDQGLINVASYIESLPMSTNNGVGDARQLKLGGLLFAKNCSICHGTEAQGLAAAAFPRLQAQHFNYLTRQLKNVRNNKRIVPTAMLDAVKTLSEAETRAIADYLSRATPPQKKIATDSGTLDILNQLKLFFQDQQQ